MPKPKQPKPKKTTLPKPGSDAAFRMADKELRRMMREGLVNPNNINKVRERISKKYGAYPHGRTR